ncbi:MAG TPA: ATP-dependent DNA helicase RecG [Syntrophales bacterium]|nr:ATP-dependent DNA helicase RecG [Syntrophales bacterium]
MSAFSRELKNVLQVNMKEAGRGGSFDRLISDFDELVAGFDKLPLDAKKERIERALTIFGRLREAAAGFSEERPVAGDSETMERNSEASFERLSRPVQFVKGVGPKLAALFEKKGVRNVEDLLYFVPRKYEDRRNVKDINSASIGSKETVTGRVTHAVYRPYKRRKAYEVTIDDGSGQLTAKWFRGNLTYLRRIFKEGTRVIMTGEVTSYLGGKDMIHPDYEVMGEDEDAGDLLHFKRIVPVYSETEGLNQKHIRRIIASAVHDYAQFVESPIPEEICRRRGLQDIEYAIRSVHFPEQNERLEDFNAMRSDAHRRLIYDEFFFLQLGLALRRKAGTADGGIAFKTGGSGIRKFYSLLPFSLTGAQKRVIAEIEADMEKQASMNRLLQGDVGCGKTVVSMAAMITACENAYEAAIMAPTEILAEQHYNNIKAWSESLGMNAVLLTGSTKGSEREKIIQTISKGDANIICGTHALIQKDLAFSRLGLVIIDEQHRFGVVQRSQLRQKGTNPDVLVMTATPIPRTLAMTVYGDLDVSIIDECPPERKEIGTSVFFEEQRDKVYSRMREELRKQNQVFIVYPLVEESESLDLNDATRMADHLQRDIFPESRVGLIHGRMKGRLRDETMASFMAGEIQILVATTVIEVGIDVPQASLMVIEHAERFGLSQLHQLRGRVGRSDIPSSCILMSHRGGSEDSARRLRVMEETNDGFRIAEEDLAIRGPGEFLGTRQSGVPDFRIANILRDSKILIEARADAFSVAEDIARKGLVGNRLLKKVLTRRWAGRFELTKTG